ncbi:hypothetical protein B0H13DRAFT_2345449 [Mycena leptocephala]|nr:hypothetical protein B0H13DRAFT_2345449 [Mycena leptocephala]
MYLRQLLQLLLLSFLPFSSFISASPVPHHHPDPEANAAPNLVSHPKIIVTPILLRSGEGPNPRDGGEGNPAKRIVGGTNAIEVSVTSIEYRRDHWEQPVRGSAEARELVKRPVGNPTLNPSRSPELDGSDKRNQTPAFDGSDKRNQTPAF